MDEAAATIAIVYPHMNSIDGDGFWVICQHGRSWLPYRSRFFLVKSP